MAHGAKKIYLPYSSQHSSLRLSQYLRTFELLRSTLCLQPNAPEQVIKIALDMEASVVTEASTPSLELPLPIRCQCTSAETTPSPQLNTQPFVTPDRLLSLLRLRALLPTILSEQLRSLTPTTRISLLVASLMVMILMREFTTITKF
ncbi:MAG: hypothetical protein [Cressdnaviricota sp.]|nr:MAG: hypothetical protein [Cressdnaviricota sp.]